MANTKFLNGGSLERIWANIKNAFVAKEEGKGLSSNDYDDAAVEKLASLENTVLNDTLTSESADEALTAKQGKVLNDAIAAVDGDLDTLSGTVETIGGDLDKAEEAIAAAEGKITAAEGKITANEGAIAANTAAIEANDGEIATLTESLGTANGKIAAVEGSITTISGDLDTAEATLAEVKAKVDTFGAAGDYALKSDITTVYRHKGSVANAEALPAEGNEVGDVYNTEETGMNYAWNGTEWDPLGTTFTYEVITNDEIDAIMV